MKNLPVASLVMWINFIPVWIGNSNYYKVRDGIIHPFQDSVAVEV